MAKTKKKIFIGGIVVIILGILIFIAVSQTKVDAKKVRVETAERGDIFSTVTATGRVEAKKEVQISADVMGRIIKLPVKEGQKVEKGDLLVQIDPTSYQADVSRARASLLQAQSSLETAEIAFDRNQELFKRKLVSQETLDLSRAEYNSAKALVAQAEASLEQAKDQLAKTTIRSPIAGTITALMSEEGENVVIGTMNNPGTVIMVVSDLSAIEVEAEVDETDIALVEIGQDVDIDLDAYPDTSFKGVVTEIGNSARIVGVSSQEQVVNFLVTILFTDVVKGIRPGMTATVDITTGVSNDAVNVPIQSIVMRAPSDTIIAESVTGNGAKAEEADIDEEEMEEEEPVEGVFLVSNGKAKFQPVTTGLADQQNIQIAEGVSEGDSIITGSYQMLRILKSGDFVEPEGR
ncbi:MAG: efflux RND transporter periplasmic adaptor subunit [candidate division Zixibacteria bacterium]|nr:efflux RND transporter periplasmic adaptor subunit [candidate division Zixibacteria bacterium]